MVDVLLFIKMASTSFCTVTEPARTKHILADFISKCLELSVDETGEEGEKRGVGERASGSWLGWAPTPRLRSST